MTSRMPVVFVSHGAPDALLKAPDTVGCWREIAERIPEPKGILVISAHWEATLPTVSLAAAPATIHDFSGFAPELHRMYYPAPGAPALAERTVSLLSSAGISAAQHPNRGLDHGAWVPLSVMFAQAHIPVTQSNTTGKAGGLILLAPQRRLQNHEPLRGKPSAVQPPCQTLTSTPQFP